MLFYLIINGLSATADGFGPEIFPSLDILPVVVQADAPGGGEEADAGGH